MGFKDYFSKQAADYARFRPSYPDELFDFLASVAPSRESAWDCGTGNGQAAVALAERFARVVGTDPSAAQIERAPARPNLRFAVASAEASALPPASADLVTVATAIHWFDLDRFYAEARRVLKPRGVLAVWSYGDGEGDDPRIEAALRAFASLIRPYFPPEVSAVWDRYRELPFPFEEIKAPEFVLRRTLSAETLLGYVGSFSAVQRYVELRGVDPRDKLREELGRLLPEGRTIERSWKLALRVGRI
jgi:SAM-dependent methyltransferase